MSTTWAPLTIACEDSHAGWVVEEVGYSRWLTLGPLLLLVSEPCTSTWLQA